VKDLYVFDANFFISLAQSRDPRAIEHILDLSAAQGWDMYSTEPIMEEVKYVRCKGSKGTAAALARTVMDVHDADDPKISSMRLELGGATRAPQSPDLSLMVLSRQLTGKGVNVRLVSDDFKISLTSRELAMPYAVISPSVYLFSLSRRLHGEERKWVRGLYRKVRHGEMEYLLSRRDLYNVEEKLNWLMDNLLQTVTSGAGAEKVHTRKTPRPEGTQDMEGASREWDALIRHLRGEHVRRGRLKSFDGIMAQLEPLMQLTPILQVIHEKADAGELEASLQRSHEELSDLKSQLQLSVGALGTTEGRLVLRAYAELLPDLEMVTALLHVNLGDVVDCEDHLDNVALLALAAGLTPTVIEANYLEALVHSYREAWEEALDQFDLTSRLALQDGDEATTLRCLIGSAVMELLSGDPEAAQSTMEEVNDRVEADPGSGSRALEEFGDHFTNFGAIHLASGLYDEALECAVEARATEDADRLMDKLRRTRLSMGLEERELATAVQDLIDHANDIQDAELLARYEELELELAETVAHMDEPLDRMFDEWSPTSRLPSPLRGWMDIIRADPLPRGEGTILICYSSKLGNVGVLVKEMIALPGIEHAHVRLNQGSLVKLVEAPEPHRSRHRLRAIVVLQGDGPYELRRALISLKVGESD
jgi:tetratricopeptide (TPR) repeat protein